MISGNTSNQSQHFRNCSTKNHIGVHYASLDLNYKLYPYILKSSKIKIQTSYIIECAFSEKNAVFFFFFFLKGEDRANKCYNTVLQMIL